MAAEPPDSFETRVGACGSSSVPPPVNAPAHPPVSCQQPSSQMQSGADLQNKLKDVTADVAGQLQSIMQEMNRLKTELYSSDGGLGDIANEIQKLKQQTGISTAGVPACGREGSCSSGLSCGGRRSDKSSRTRSDNLSDRHASEVGPREQPKFARRVSFDKEAMSRTGNGRRPDDPRGRNMPRRSSGAETLGSSWMPYVIAFVLMCVGPMRPILWNLISDLLGGLYQDREPAWYDA